MDYNIPINFAGLDLKNPVIIASGILGLSQNIFDRLSKNGVGAIVSKSISILPRIGYRNPTVVPLDNQNWLNAVGLANPGADAFSQEILNNKIPLFVSIVGSSTEEFRTIVQKFQNSKILGFELNLSCPHVDRMGMEIGDDPKLVREIIESIKDQSKKPLIVKVGLGKSDILQIAKIAEDAGADGITAINTLRAMKIDIDNKCPILENNIGGLSGAAIRPIGVRCVYELYRVIKIPIIGCGGIFTISDMLEYIMAGASAVQVGSFIAHNGMESIGKLITDLRYYLESEGYKRVGEIVGIAHR
ncbi:MAG TPA: dihydroorotate dehydrogenase [Candidatus Nitrosocosmicus sp.]|nr:dihydroorotate dehydrogenase [Candidatus Nitrosocosmicus sp.]